jgi:tetratricopeptide (TPR) repeat protein/DNA-binding CsgD family transcriptional regulator
MRPVFIAITTICFFFGTFAQKTPETDSLENAITGEHSIAQKLELYIQLIEIYQLSDLEKAASMCNEALRLAESERDAKSMGLIHILKGNLEVRSDSIAAAERDYTAAVEWLTGTPEDELLIQAHTALGNLYTEKENYPAAMEQFHMGIRISEEKSKTDKLPNLYNNLGVIYVNLNNPQKALDLYTKALVLFERKHDSINIAGTTTNIGSIYIQLGNYRIARQYYRAGLALFEKIGLRAGQAHALFKLGILFEMEKEYDSAIHYLDLSYTLQDNLGLLPSGSPAIFRAETEIHLGVNYYESGKIEVAKVFLQKGYQNAYQNGQISLVSLAAKFLSDIKKKENDFKSALEYHGIFKRYSDSLYNEENVRKLTRLEMQYQYESQIAKARLEKELEEQKRKRTNLVYILVTAALLLVLVIIILLLRLEKNKKKKLSVERAALQEKLDHTSKELTTYVMHLLQKNELILSIIEKLKHARIDATTENKKVIAELIAELQSSTGRVSWEEFELRFQQVHTEFYTHLRMEFPDLTNNEIRLCAFFRLNMTTKEIAAITYQSLNSIKVARYRLRKKLHLTQDQSLSYFLSRY